MTERYFIKYWPEDSPIDRWNNDGKALNKIILMYNQWQMNEGFETMHAEARTILVHIQYGKDTLGEASSDYVKELERMEDFVTRMTGLPNQSSLSG